MLSTPVFFLCFFGGHHAHGHHAHGTTFLVPMRKINRSSQSNMWHADHLSSLYVNMFLRPISRVARCAYFYIGPAPIYIGFGSLVVDNAKLLTEQFLTALQRTGLRAIIQRGWGEWHVQSVQATCTPGLRHECTNREHRSV